MALTSSLAGVIGGFSEDIIILRHHQLQKMGIDFTNRFNEFSKVITFFNFKTYAGVRPMFYHGILSTNGEGDASKGDVLVPCEAFHISQLKKDEEMKKTRAFSPFIIDLSMPSAFAETL